MAVGANALQLPARYRLVPVLVGTWLSVGIVDITYAFLFYGMFGAKPGRILQGIASGLLGRAAFAQGDRTVFLGLFLHFFIAFSVTAFYFLLASRWMWLNRNALLSGLGYGAGVFVVMHYLVIPLSANPGGHMPLISQVCEFVEHMLFVGSPIAWAARMVFLQPGALRH